MRSRRPLALDADLNPPEPLRRSGPVVLAAAGLALAAIALTTLRALGESSAFLGNAMTSAAMLFALVGMLMAAARTTGDERRAWRWFAGGTALYLTGEVLWTVEDAVGEQTGTSIADAFWLVAVLMFFVALHLRSRGMVRPSPPVESLVDSLIVMGLFGILIWKFVLEGALEAGDPIADTAVQLAYPAADLALLWMLLRTTYRSRASWTLEQSLLAAGLIALVVGDILWALPGGDVTFALSDFAYTTFGLALGGAGFVSASAASRAGPDAPPPGSRPFAIDLMPYIVGIGMGIVPVWLMVSGERDVIVAIAAAAVLVLVFVRLAIAVREDRQMRERAEEAAVSDALTGLMNHRYFQERLKEELGRARRSNATVGLLMVDIDRFKEVNDTVGHLGGDRLLSELGRAVRAACRPSDTPCRVGGDELAVIVPGVTRTTLQTVAERIFENAARIRIATSDAADGDLRVSLSIGGCTFPDEAPDQRSLVEKADIALYRSKGEGRGRITLYEPDFASPVSPGEKLVAAERQIRMRELDLSRVFGAAPDPLLILSSDGSILDANPAACSVSGLSAEQLRGSSIWDFVPAASEEALARLVAEEGAETGGTGESEIVLPDGRVRWIEFNFTSLPPDRRLLAVRDVTEERAALAQVAQSEERFRALFDNAPDAIYVLDDEGTILDANAAAVELTEGSREQLIGAKASDLVNEAGDRARIDALQRELVEGESAGGIFEAVWPDGSRRAVQYRSVANFLPGRHLSIVRDVTEEVAARREITEHEAVFRAAVETIDEGLVVVGPEGVVRSGSPTAARILGVPESELVGSQHPRSGMGRRRRRGASALGGRRPGVRGPARRRAAGRRDARRLAA